MKLHDIKPDHKNRKLRRIARGTAGKGGKTGGRGTKGQKARTGFNIPRGFEGGQTKLIMRLPKTGGFRKERSSQIVKTSQINKNFKSTDTISPETLFEKKLIRKGIKLVKVLFDEKLASKFKFKDCKMSKKVEQELK